MLVNVAGGVDNKRGASRANHGVPHDFLRRKRHTGGGCVDLGLPRAEKAGGIWRGMSRAPMAGLG